MKKFRRVNYLRSRGKSRARRRMGSHRFGRSVRRSRGRRRR